ncbi:MAG: hypothetical protein ACFB20_07075 [Opitutales bacterium]
MYVILDNESVDFDGPPPPNPRACFDLLNTHLAANGRCLLHFEADGTDILAQTQPRFPESAQEVRAQSTSQAYLVGQLAQGQLGNLRQLIDCAARLPGEFLAQPWSLTQTKLPAFSAALEPILQLLAPLQAAAATLDKSAEAEQVTRLETTFSEGFQALANAAQFQSPAEVSEALADTLNPALKSLYTLLADGLLPALEAHRA